jgi:hypothetical protein
MRSGSMHATARPQSRPSIARALQSACALVAQCDGIVALHVSTTPRLAYPELLRLKAGAARLGVALTVASDGGVVLRRPVRGKGVHGQ